MLVCDKVVCKEQEDTENDLFSRFRAFYGTTRLLLLLSIASTRNGVCIFALLSTFC